MTWWRRRRDLDDPIELLAARQVVAETVTTALVAMVLRCVDPELRDRILSELREGITVGARSVSKPEGDLALFMDEYAAKMIDEIEGIGRASFDAAAPLNGGASRDW